MMRTALATVGLLSLAACSPHKALPPERLAAMQAIQAEIRSNAPACTAPSDSDWGQAACLVVDVKWTEAIYLKIRKEIQDHGSPSQRNKLIGIERKASSKLEECEPVTTRLNALEYYVAQECRSSAISSKMNDAVDVMWSEAPRNTPQQ